MDDKAALEKELGQNMTEEGMAKLRAIQQEIADSTANESDIDGYGLASASPTTY